MHLKKLINNQSIRNAGWLIGGNITHKLIAFFVGIWTARYLGPSNYGLISYATAYLTFFFSLATLGINSVLVKRFVDKPEQEGETLGTALVLQSIASILSILMILLVVFVVDYGESLTITVVFLSSLGLFFQILDSVKYWFQSKLQSKYAAVATIIAYMISSGYKVILLITGKPVTWFAVATSLDYLCVAVILYAVYKRKGGPRLRFTQETAKDLLKTSYPYIFSGLMVSVYGATDKVMLKQMMDESVVGIYGTAMSIANLWVFVLSAIIDSVKPVILAAHKTSTARFRKMNVSLYAAIFYISMFVSIFMILFADLGIGLLYGEAYQGASPILRIATFYVAFAYLGVARDIWVICEHQQKHLPKLYMGAAVLNVVLNAVLIPRIGAQGAAIATLATQISTVFVMPMFIKTMRPNVRMMLDAVLLKCFRKEQSISDTIS